MEQITIATSGIDDLLQLRAERRERAQETYRRMLRGEPMSAVDKEIAMMALGKTDDQLIADLRCVRQFDELKRKKADHDANADAARRNMDKAKARLLELAPARKEIAELDRLYNANFSIVESLEIASGRIQADLTTLGATIKSLLDG